MIFNGKIKNESNYLHLIRFWKICRRKHRRPVCVSFWAFPGLLRYKAKPCMSSPRSLAGHLPIKEVSPQERAPKHWLVLRRRTTDRNSESILIFPSGWQRPKYLGHYHLLPPSVYDSRKLVLGTQLQLELQYSNTGCDYRKWNPNHPDKCLSWQYYTKMEHDNPKNSLADDNNGCNKVFP